MLLISTLARFLTQSIDKLIESLIKYRLRKMVGSVS